MEKLKAKHDHKLTDVLKVIIFALFLLMPFLTYMPNAFYYGFNEHAEAQEKTIQEPIYYESNEVNNYTDLVNDNLYVWTDSYEGAYLESDSNIFSIKNNSLIRGQFTSITLQSTIYLRIRTNNVSLLITNSTNGGNNYISVVGRQFSFVFDTLLNSQYAPYITPYIAYTDLQVVKEYRDTTYTQAISESMYNGWQLMWQSPLYTWTNQSVLKTGLDNFTAVFGVSNNSYITNLLTYELIIVAIYIVIDIVITLFTWLTHLFNKE